MSAMRQHAKREQQFSRVCEGTGSPNVTTRALTDTAGYIRHRPQAPATHIRCW